MADHQMREGCGEREKDSVKGEEETIIGRVIMLVTKNHRHLVVICCMRIYPYNP